jgi:hypothetical protein
LLRLRGSNASRTYLSPAREISSARTGPVQFSGAAPPVVRTCDRTARGPTLSTVVHASRPLVAESVSTKGSLSTLWALFTTASALALVAGLHERGLDACARTVRAVAPHGAGEVPSPGAVRWIGCRHANRISPPAHDGRSRRVLGHAAAETSLSGYTAPSALAASRANSRTIAAAGRCWVTIPALWPAYIASASTSPVVPRTGGVAA